MFFRRRKCRAAALGRPGYSLRFRASCPVGHSSADWMLTKGAAAPARWQAAHRPAAADTRSLVPA